MSASQNTPWTPDEGIELLFGRQALLERLLWALTDTDPIDSEMGDLLCCDSYDYGVHMENPADRWNSWTFRTHTAGCAWMRAHRALNRSTVHGHYVHEWSAT